MKRPKLSPKQLLASLRTGGAVSRARIYHDAPTEDPAARMPFEQHQRAAQVLGLDPRAIMALAVVETRDRPFIDGVPIVRLETHKWRQFRQATRSAKAFDQVKNFRDLTLRWSRFEDMQKLQSGPAIKSHSFGAFQIMGFNLRRCGFENAEAFLAAMKTVDGQTSALIRLVQSTPALLRGLKDLDGHVVGHHYNGRNYRQNNYHTKWLAALETPRVA